MNKIWSKPNALSESELKKIQVSAYQIPIHSAGDLKCSHINSDGNIFCTVWGGGGGGHRQKKKKRGEQVLAPTKNKKKKKKKKERKYMYVQLWSLLLLFLHFIFVLQSNLSLRPPDKSDHLKIADTHFQSLQFADSNARSAFLKMRPPEKCELRTPEVGPKLRFNLGKATTYVKLSEKHSFDRPAFPSQALRTGNHGVCKIILVRSLPITPLGAYGNYRSLITMARARACVQLHIEKFKTKPGKWDHLGNRTTYSQSLRWS